MFDKDSPIVGQGVVDRVHAFEIIFERFAKVLLPWKVSTVSDPNRVCFRAEFLAQLDAFNVECIELGQKLDRKSTRLNSSHSQISYAVFCLKKKKRLMYR